MCHVVLGKEFTTEGAGSDACLSSKHLLSPLIDARHSSQAQKASPHRVGYFSQPAQVKRLRYRQILCHSFSSKTQQKLPGAIAFNGEGKNEQSLKKNKLKSHSQEHNSKKRERTPLNDAACLLAPQVLPPLFA